MISLFLYKILNMKKIKEGVYRIDKKGNLIISMNPINCALNICSPSLVMLYYDKLKKEIKYVN